MTDLPAKIGRYEILAKLGRGGMGVVYKARDPNIDRVIALKVIRLGDDADERFAAMMRERFQREAKAAGQLIHPNIVTVFDAGEDQGLPFMAMELVEGETLDRIMRRRAGPTVELAGRIISQAARGLEFAHQKGVIHRDVKPSNIIVCPDLTAKIMDFGIARIIGSEYTKQGTIIGSPNYMSPEQITGQPADQRSDVFALGVILYEMLTGERPFLGESETTISYRVVQINPDPPSKLNPILDPAWDQVMARALAKRPEDRYASAAEMARDLERIAAGEKLDPYEKPADQGDSTAVVMPSESGASSQPGPSPVKPPDYEAPVKSGNRRQSFRVKAGLAALALILIVASAFALLKDKDPYSAIIKDIEAGKHEKALAKLKKMINKNPDDAKAHYLLAGEQTALKDYESATAAYARALELDPEYQTDPVILDNLLITPAGTAADQAIALIAEKLGTAQHDRLLAGLANPDFNAHWNSARALEQMGEEVDPLPLLVMDLKDNPDCGVRKDAANKLAELEDKKALTELEQAKTRPENQDPCMGSAIDDAIAAIKKAKAQPTRHKPRSTPAQKTGSTSSSDNKKPGYRLKKIGEDLKKDFNKTFNRDK